MDGTRQYLNNLDISLWNDCDIVIKLFILYIGLGTLNLKEFYHKKSNTLST